MTTTATQQSSTSFFWPRTGQHRQYVVTGGEQGQRPINAVPRIGHGRDGTRPAADTATILRTARDLIGLARDDADRRAQVMQCLRAIRALDDAAFEGRYEVAVLRRYYDLLGARLRRDAPPYRRPSLAPSPIMAMLAAADDLARDLVPRLAAGGHR
jgi:hypothetical protein